MNTIITNEARKVLLLGLQNHMIFRVVGSGEAPHEPVYKDEWWFERLDGQNIPLEGKRRLEVLRRAGIHIQDVIVAHEAPRLLTAPKKERDSKISPPKGILTFLVTLASVYVQLVLFVVAILFQTVLIDPALIVVLKDGSWIEVVTWLE